MSEVAKIVKNVVEEQFKELSKEHKHDESSNDGMIKVEDIIKHQESCNCPSCPYCSAMRNRIEETKEENLLKNTISKLDSTIQKKMKK